MKPNALLCAIAATLLLGIAPAAMSQSDHGRGHGRNQDQGQQVQPQDQPPPGQARHARQPDQGRPQQPQQQPQRTYQRQDRRQYQPQRDSQQQPRQTQQPQQRQSRQYQQPRDDSQQRPYPQRQSQGRTYSSPRSQYNAQPRAIDRVRNRISTTQSDRVYGRSSRAIVEQRTIWPRYQSRDWGSQHRTWIQRGGYGGYRIPMSRFNVYFGRRHRFHLSNFNVRVVGSYPEFYADGYWFTMLDPIPYYWGEDWYYNDYVTVVYVDGGYYLLDEAYPDDLVAIDVRLG